MILKGMPAMTTSAHWRGLRRRKSLIFILRAMLYIRSHEASS